MNKLFSILFLVFGLLSCNQRKTDNNILNDKQDSMEIVNKEQLPQIEGMITRTLDNIRPNYDISSYIFDSLSQERKVEFIAQNKNDINQTLIYHFDHYSTTRNPDSIFNILVACDFSSESKKELLPFYIYVLSDVIKNKHVDGYVGESINDICYSFLNNYPGRYYQFMNFANDDLKDSFVGYTAIGIYFNNTISIDSIFEKHKLMLPNRKKQITSIENKMKTICNNFD